MNSQDMTYDLNFIVVAATAVLLFAATMTITKVITKSTAAVRHSMLALAFLLVLALPLLPAFSPVAPVAVLELTGSAVETPTNRAAMHLANANNNLHVDLRTSGEMSTSTTAVRESVERHSHSWSARPSVYRIVTIRRLALLLVGGEWLWIIGAAYFTARIAIRALKVMQKGENSVAAGERVRDLALICDRVMKMNVHTTVRIASKQYPIAVPITWGLFRPVVLLPEHVDEWSDVCVCAALMHEYAHIERRDWAVQTVVQLVCALHWFNPLAWIASGALRAESESATDDAVLRQGLTRTQYAQSLIDVARSMPKLSQRTVSAIAMASPLDVKRRVLEILDTTRNRNGAQHGRLVVASFALCLLTFPNAVLRVEAQGTISTSHNDDVQAAPKFIVMERTRDSKGLDKKTSVTVTEKPKMEGKAGTSARTYVFKVEDFQEYKKLRSLPKLEVIKVLPDGSSLSADEREELSNLPIKLQALSKVDSLSAQDLQDIKIAQSEVTKSEPDMQAACAKLANLRFLSWEKKYKEQSTHIMAACLRKYPRDLKGVTITGSHIIVLKQVGN
jgi:beta-lactamase regulating signal transducer with metallopeptidase domain